MITQIHRGAHLKLVNKITTCKGASREINIAVLENVKAVEEIVVVLCGQLGEGSKFFIHLGLKTFITG